MDSRNVPLQLGFDADDLLRLRTETIPFGRYAGRCLIDLPEEYLLWFERREFPNGELGRLMKLALGLKRDGTDELIRRPRR